MKTAGWKFGCHSYRWSSERHREYRVPKSPLIEKFKHIAITKSASAFLITVTLMLGGLSCGVCARPFISSVSPTSTIAGGSQLLLTVNGSDFRRDSLVVWNGTFLVTGFVTSHQLVVVVPASDIALTGTVVVFVFNPSDGGTTSVSGALGGNIFVNGCAARDSNAVVFTITP